MPNRKKVTSWFSYRVNRASDSQNPLLVLMVTFWVQSSETPSTKWQLCHWKARGNFQCMSTVYLIRSNTGPSGLRAIIATPRDAVTLSLCEPFTLWETWEYVRNLFLPLICWSTFIMFIFCVSCFTFYLRLKSAEQTCLSLSSRPFSFLRDDNFTSERIDRIVEHFDWDDELLSEF